MWVGSVKECISVECMGCDFLVLQQTHCLLKSRLGESVHIPGGQLWGQRDGHYFTA